MNFQLKDFDYVLPERLIAQYPLPERATSRLLKVNSHSDSLSHGSFHDIESVLTSNDLLVLNETRVIPARLFGQKATGGKVECLIERLLPAELPVYGEHCLLAHIRASKSPKPGMKLIIASDFSFEVLAREEDLFVLRYTSVLPILEALKKYGHYPLPPYIHRKDEPLDQERYQTVFAEHPGAVAAPTAGLHFDESTLARIAARGTAIEKLTLHVGAGTFQPVRADRIEDHEMHAEWINVSERLCEAVKDTHLRGGRVFAVGTTVLRALESAAISGPLKAYIGDTRIFITPGFRFRVADALLTNFHLPRSTLLMLVCAFAGYELMMRAYRTAVAESYRFFSYGDAMLILR